MMMFERTLHSKKPLDTPESSRSTTNADSSPASSSACFVTDPQLALENNVST